MSVSSLNTRFQSALDGILHFCGDVRVLGALAIIVATALTPAFAAETAPATSPAPASTEKQFVPLPSLQEQGTAQTEQAKPKTRHNKGFYVTSSGKIIRR